MATIRRRATRTGETRWQVMVRRRGVEATRTFETKAAGERWARRIESEADHGGDSTMRAGGTVADLLDVYEREMRALGKPFGRSKAASLAMMRRHLGSLPMRRLDTAAVQAFARARRDQGAGPATIAVDLSFLATALTTVRSLLRVSVTAQPVLEARQALRAVGVVGSPRTRSRRPTRPELAALIAHLRARHRTSVPMDVLIEFAVASGMRAGEILRLRWIDLDPGRRVILVRDRKDPRRKEGNHQLVPLLDVTGYDALRIILAQPRTGERIFPYGSSAVSAAFTRACQALGIEDLHFHDCRAEAASRMFEAGMAVEEVALVTGHREWKTLQRYARLRPEDVAARRGPRSPLTAPVRPATG